MELLFFKKLVDYINGRKKIISTAKGSCLF